MASDRIEAAAAAMLAIEDECPFEDALRALLACRDDPTADCRAHYDRWTAKAADVLAHADRAALAQAGELVERLTKAAGSPVLNHELASACAKAAAALTAQAARIADLESALRPFVECSFYKDITAEQQERARAALGDKP